MHNVLIFFFNNGFLWLSSAGNSDKDAGDKQEGVHESTGRGNSGYTVFQEVEVRYHSPYMTLFITVHIV